MSKSFCYFLGLVALMSIVCCADDTERADIKLEGLHCWNTSWDDSLMNLKSIQEFETYYVHVFDVDKEKNISEPIPSFILDTIITKPDKNYIPIAYLTTEAFEWYIENGKIEILADRINGLLVLLSQKFNYSFSKFILDYDWRRSDQEYYFNLVNFLRDKLKERNVTLSVSLRLHQLRLSEEMKAPPVEEVYLMCYNMGNFRAASTKNSIYDPKDFEIYAKNIGSYPAKIEYILPVYDHVILFRQGKFEGLMMQISNSDLEHETDLFLRQADNFYKVKTDVKFKDYSLHKGDEIKYETVDDKDIKHMIKVINEEEEDSIFLSIFDLKNYTTNDEMQNYFQSIF